MSYTKNNVAVEERLHSTGRVETGESKITVGIDATNLRGGGGVTHIVELLTAAEPTTHGIAKVVVWGGVQTLEKIPDRDWLRKISPPALNRNILLRTLWQRFALSRAATRLHCDVLFVPGGSYAGRFKPVVTLSQNLLPFEQEELGRYGLSLMALKLLILRFTQSRSFQLSDGLVFLTDYANKTVLKVTGPIAGRMQTIPHGVSPRFQLPVKPQRRIEDYTDANPYRLLYVSIIDEYKHQWHLIEAVHTLREEGFPLVIELVGPAYSPALAKVHAAVARFDPENSWVHYRGAISHEGLHSVYARADLAVFASSCENMPIILLEAMASGLPVACSNRGPMPEILQNAGLYFDPEEPGQIASALRQYIRSPILRQENAEESSTSSRQFTWERCADETFAFLFRIAKPRAVQ